jgi:hypothetical protein
VSDSYSTTRNGLTFGWVSGAGQGRDRSASVDVRIAGTNFASSGVWDFLLPEGAGTYNIRIGFGDATQDYTDIECEIADYNGTTETSLFTLGPLSLTHGIDLDMADAEGTVMSNEDWPSSNVTVQHTFSGDRLRLNLGDGVGDHPIAYIALEHVTASRLAPDAILTQTNLTGVLADITDDPDSADGNWLTADSNNADSDLAVSFPTPAGNPTTGAGLQEFRVQYRVTANATSTTFNAYLRENGTRINGGTAIDTWASTSTTGEVRGITWDASLLGTADGSLVEIEIVATKTGGSPGNRTTGEFGAVEWNANEDASTTPVSNTIDLQYSTEESVSQTLDLQYSTEESVSQTLDLQYSTEEGVSQTLDLQYSTEESGMGYNTDTNSAATFATTNTLSYTAGTGSNRLLIFAVVNYDSGANNLTGITYDGTSIIANELFTYSHFAGDYYVYYVPEADILTGARDVVATFDASEGAQIYGVTLTNCPQSSVTVGSVVSSDVTSTDTVTLATMDPPSDGRVFGLSTSPTVSGPTYSAGTGLEIIRQGNSGPNKRHAMFISSANDTAITPELTLSVSQSDISMAAIIIGTASTTPVSNTLDVQYDVEASGIFSNITTASQASADAAVGVDIAIGSGSNRILICAITQRRTPGNLADPVINSVTGTAAVSPVNLNAVSTGIWYWLDTDLPSAGTYAVTYTGAGNTSISVLYAEDAYQSAPMATASLADNSDDPTLALTGGGEHSLSLISIARESTSVSMTSNTGQIDILAPTDVFSDWHAMSYEVGVTSLGYTTGSAQDQAVAAVSVQAATQGKLIGRDDSVEFTGTAEMDASRWVAEINGPPSNSSTGRVVADTTGTAETAYIYIQDWGNQDNIKMALYGPNGYDQIDIATFNVSSGTGLITAAFADGTQTITAGSEYFVALWCDDPGNNGSGPLSLYRDTSSSKSRYKDLTGHFDTPSDPFPSSGYSSMAANREFEWFITGTAGGGTTPVSQTLSLQYDVDGSVSQTLDLQYSTEASVSQSLDLQYDTQVSASQAIDLQYSVEQSVSQTSDLRYSLEGVVSQTSELQYSVEEAVSQTSDIQYSMVEAVSQTSELQYSIAEAVSQTSDLQYSVEGAVTQTADLQYSIADTVSQTSDIRYGIEESVSQTSELQYSVLESVEQTSDLRFDMEGSVSQTSDIRYGVEESVSQTSDIRYDTEQAVSQTLDVQYDNSGTVGVVSQTLDLQYSVEAHISQDLDVQYTVTNDVSQTSELQYNLLSAVSQTVDAQYSMEGTVEQTLDVRYGAESSVQQSLDLRYSSEEAVSQTSDLQYSVLEDVSQTSDLQYGIEESVSNTLDVQYDNEGTQGVVTQSLDIRYDAEATVESLSDIRYEIAATVASTSTLIYSVDVSVTQTSDIRYSINESVTQLVTLEFAIEGSVSQALTVQYETVSTVTATSDLIYSIQSDGTPVNPLIFTVSGDGREFVVQPDARTFTPNQEARGFTVPAIN